ncbi:MAG TPA: hypothetical protein VF469_18345 [Kofleriaceae bacterium]
MSALASFLLVGACMAGEDSAGKAELGTGNETPADGTSGGGGVNINARFQVKKLTTDDQAFQTADFTDKQLQDVWGVTTLAKEAGSSRAGGTFLDVAQTTGLLIEVEPNGNPTGTRIMLDKAITGIANNESDRIQLEVKGKCGRASVLVASQSGRLWAANPEVSTTTGFVVLDATKVKAQFTGVALIPELGKQGKGDDGGDDGHGGGQSGCGCDGHGGNDIRQTVLAVDFHNGLVRGYNDQFQPINLGDRFQIPDLSNKKEKFSPFGIKKLDDMVVVTAAVRRDPVKGEPQIDQQVAGNGKGIVAAFKLDGTLIWSTNQPGHQPQEFDIPWGLEMGGIKLCAKGTALLVSQHGLDDRLDGQGNESGGTIVALDPTNGDVLGRLMDGKVQGKDQPVRVQGIWGLTFGANIKGMAQDLLHLGAGPTGRNDGKPPVSHGLFARLDMAQHKDP